MTLAEHEDSSFGTLLKAFRTHRHLTQHLLARAVGVNRSTVVRWEQGYFLPESKTMVLEIVRHLHLNEQESRSLLEASLTALSPYWLIPLPRNPFFTGREEILETLHTWLGPNQAIAPTQSSALHGLGGVGKTQIALEYAYRYALEYSAVFWIGAETEEQVVSSYLRIAEVLQLPERDDNDQQRVVTAVQRWLLTHGQWLLIWDNVEDLTILDRFLPSARSGAILLTTRCHALGTFAQSLNLFPMEQDEGMLFLLRRARVVPAKVSFEQMRQLVASRPTEDTAARELVTVLGGLPLALDQAGAYLETTQCGVAAYLVLFHTRRAVLLQQRGENERYHPTSVSTTFTLALAAIVGHHPAVGDLLRACALLQSDAIPEELFRKASEHMGATLEAACSDHLEWDQVLAVACSSSLLSRQGAEQTISLHRLVQAIVLDTMTEFEQEQWTGRLIEALEAVFPGVQIATKSVIWKQAARLLPHALLCLQRVEQAHQALPFASLADKVGQYLFVRGQYTQARPFFQGALHTREQLLGQDHLQVASSLYGLANLAKEQGKYAEAEMLHLRSLKIREQLQGSIHPDVAFSLHGLAILYNDLGNFTEAEQFFQRALHIREQSLGSDHPDVATSLNSLANLYNDLGKYTEAEPLYQRALRIWEQQLGSDHPQMAFSLNNLANLYSRQGRYTEAQPFYQRTLQIWEQQLGSEHPLVAHPLNGLGDIYFKQGKYTQAETLYQRALQIWEQQLGSEHPLVAFSYNALADIYFKQGKYTQAERLYQQALQIWKQQLGSEHPYVIYALNGLANLFREQGKYAEAEALFQHALSIQEQQLGQHHPETGQILHDFALLRQKQKNLCEALSLAERALKIHAQFLGEAHPQTVATQALFTQLLQEQASIETRMNSEQCAKENKNGFKQEQVKERGAIPLYQTDDGSPVEIDPLRAFLNDCCEWHPQARTEAGALWQAYKQWVDQQQEHFPLSRRAFTTQLKAYGCRAGRTNTTRLWYGIALMKK